MEWTKRKPIKTPDENASIIDRLASVRGIENIDDWLNPPITSLHDPYELENIDEAVQRINKAVFSEEKITIMADVDADGISSCSILYNYLRAFTGHLDFIHAQRSDGHGVETVLEEKNMSPRNSLVRHLSKERDLLIIVDSSSNSIEECKFIKDEYDMDIIIIDHHEIDSENPYATIVNCQKGSYPNKSLSGSAMVYKVCQVLDDYMGLDGYADNFMDLAAIGLIADLMKVSEMENRYIINEGLKNIQNVGLRTIFNLAKIEYQKGLSTTDIGFKVSPVFNACTRYDKIELALRLLTEENEMVVLDTAKEMIKLNDQRKEEESEIVELAMSKVDNSNKIAILVDDEIGSGFRGLIATQLVSRLKKPCFVLKYDEEYKMYNGSARTYGNIKLKNLVEVTGDFEYAQGHEEAFGLGIKEENFEQSMKALNKLLEDEKAEKPIIYDFELAEDDITEMEVNQIEMFSRISGFGASKPKFKVSNVVVDSRSVLGKKKKETIKIKTASGMELMKFKVNDQYALDIEEALNDDERFLVEIDAVGSLGINNFFNWGKKEWVRTIQLLIEDYKILD